MFDTLDWKPWALVGLGAIWGFVFDRLARLHRPESDSGDYWTRTVEWCLYPLATLLLLSWLSHSFGAWPGLYSDQTAEFAQDDIVRYGLLAGPFIFWALALAFGFFVKPATAESARWLAGGVGFANSRHWLWGQVAVLAVLLGLGASPLDGMDTPPYPAGVWSVLAVTALTLAGIACSGGRPPWVKAVAVTPQAQALAKLEDWPGLMVAANFQIENLANWTAADAPARTLPDPSAQGLAVRFEAMGARGLAPELIEAVTALMRREPCGGDGYGAVRVVFGPDDCGQTESVGLMASLLDRQSHTVTLIITPQGADWLVAQLQGWLPESVQRIVALRYGELPENAAVWVADAEILSDFLLPKLKDSPRSIARVGLVVWWRLHDYSGVMAANLWAITRRLHRLLRMHGREDLRTLALLCRVADDAQTDDFVRRLLPHAVLPKTYVEPRRAQAVALHVVHARDAKAAARQHLLLGAAAASMAGKWPTAIAPPDFISADEFAQFCGQTVNGLTIGGQLCPSPDRAGARLLQIRPADLLALPDMLSQGGRGIEGLAIHHVGIMQPVNPYMAYKLKGLTKTKGFTASRRLICAESCPAIIKRHLLLGLNELPETRGGLLDNALWKQDSVDETLGYLARVGKLSKEEVRYLDGNNRLAIDFEYRSRDTPDDQYRPLDTVGLKLIKVREPAGGGQGGGIRMRLDPERLLIKAYPGRVFMHEGRRYRISDWSCVEDVVRKGELDCRLENRARSTWRCNTSRLYGIKPLDDSAPVAIGRQGRLTRLAVELSYAEEVTGRIEWTDDPCREWMDTIQQSFYIEAIANDKSPIKTQAQVLRLMDPPDDASALPSLCQALRHVLPVHLGIEEDALAVVSLNGESRIGGEGLFGIAIVDLYPGGIGLIKAVHDDSAFWLDVLQSTSEWLENCRAEDLRQHPIALAAGADQPPQPQAALKVLRQVLTTA